MPPKKREKAHKEKQFEWLSLKFSILTNSTQKHKNILNQTKTEYKNKTFIFITVYS